MRKRTRRASISFLPVIAAGVVLAVLLLILWVIPHSELLVGPQYAPQCGQVLREDTVLDNNLICSMDRLGSLPARHDERFVFFVQKNGVVLDCQGHMIYSETGIGVLGEMVRNLEIKNCRFKGMDLGVSLRKSQNVSIHDSSFSTHKGGIEVLESG